MSVGASGAKPAKGAGGQWPLYIAGLVGLVLELAAVQFLLGDKVQRLSIELLWAEYCWVAWLLAVQAAAVVGWACARPEQAEVAASSKGKADAGESLNTPFSQFATEEELCAEECSDLGAPDVPHLEGGFVPPTTLVYSNGPEGFPFDNELCSGSFLPLHRATFDKELDASGAYPFGDHFAGKKRVWEMRFQFKFKQRPTSTLFFGVELEAYVPLSSSTKRVLEMTVALIRKGVGDSVYHSPGDDPDQVSGELERPVCTMPLFAFDQVIETPAGEEPPSLSDPKLPEMGMKRFGRVKEFIKAIENLDVRPGPTYTMCFWGCSRFIDVINWKVQGIPILTPLDLNKFAGRPPLYVTVYTLDESKEKRHLQSRKRYYFRCGFWSSLARPPREVVKSLIWGKMAQDALQAVRRGRSSESPSRTLRKRRKEEELGMGSYLCCWPRSPASPIRNTESEVYRNNLR